MFGFLISNERRRSLLSVQCSLIYWYHNGTRDPILLINVLLIFLLMLKSLLLLALCSRLVLQRTAQLASQSVTAWERALHEASVLV